MAKFPANRPDGWENPYKDRRGFEAQCQAFEDGADAMTEMILRDFWLVQKEPL